MLGEVPCEDVVGSRLPRLSDKVLAVGKGRGSSLAMFSSAISGGPGPALPVSSILSVAGFAVSDGPQRLGGQNLDRLRPLLEGGRPLLAGGSGSRLSGLVKQI